MLEDRVLFSAVPMGEMLQEGVDSVQADLADSLVDAFLPPDADVTNVELSSESRSDHSLMADDDEAGTERIVEDTDDVLPDEADNDPMVERIELVFVDASVEDHESFVRDIQNRGPGGTRFDVVLLTGEESGIAAISSTLQRHRGVDAIHLVSHGNSTGVQLGSDWLAADNVSRYAWQVGDWQYSLGEDADLLIYGCDLASSVEGRELLESLGGLCDCDVAASNDDTGNAQLGGDWELEYTLGTVESQTAFSDRLQQNWGGLLQTLAVTTTNDIIDGDTSSISNLLTSPGDDGTISLREAIIAANNTTGADDITLGAGTYLLTIAGTNEDNSATGDLDINDDLTIVGANASTTIIDADGIDRVLHFVSGTISLEQLTITGGVLNKDGAGIHNDATATLTNVAITNNAAAGKNGGAIHNDGDLTLSGVTISGNSAAKGAGIFTHDGASLSLTNTTISGNTATDQGGGLHLDHAASITSSTIAFNQAGNSAAGVFANGTLTLQNTIVAENRLTDSTPQNFDAPQPINSLGFNIDSDGTGGLSGTGDLSNVDPLLSPLASNGGPTETHALTDASPAINSGATTGAPSVDQRGIPRDSLPDIGGFEATVSAGKLYWTDPADNAVLRANTDGSSVQVLVTGLSDPRGIAVDVDGGKVYWSDRSTKKIQRSDLDGGNVEDILTGLDDPQFIELDLVNDKIYFADDEGFGGKIERADLDGSNLETAVGITLDPNGVAVDPNGGKVYWTDTFAQALARANLDGTSTEVLATSQPTPQEIELDVAAGKVYWVNDGGSGDNDRIRRADLDGSDDEDLITGQATPRGLVLDVDNGKLFFTESDKIKQADLDGSNLITVLDSLSAPSGVDLITIESSNKLVVDTTSDIADGDTSSISALLADRGFDGFISLREAITATNNTSNGATPDEIHFNIPGSGVQTISVSTPLDNIIEAVAIDATTQPGYSSSPLIELDGLAAGGDAFSIRATASGTTIRGFVIGGFSGEGVEILSDNNVVELNYIGTDASGMSAVGNHRGIEIDGGQNNLISSNLISGNTSHGVWINEGTGTASGNTIRGNLIGTAVNGSADLGNAEDGIRIESSGNTIGGAAAGQGNTISGNDNNGIVLTGTSASGNTLRGNKIGVNSLGTVDTGNTLSGVLIANGATLNVVGDSTVSDGKNIISGNDNFGVLIKDTGTAGNELFGNHIGVDIVGSSNLGNTLGGVKIEAGAANNHIGRASASTSNVISGNDNTGVAIRDDGTRGNTVEGNFIGVNFDGTAQLPNNGDGVAIYTGADDNTIGGTAAGARNIISANTASGIAIRHANTTGNVVQGNYIGLDVTGSADLGNLSTGILIELGASDNTIGGAASGAGNIVSGNDSHGISVNDGSGITIQGNTIGSGVNGTENLRNDGSGVSVSAGGGSSNIIIGGDAVGEGNLIAFNNERGIFTTGTGSGDEIVGNTIHSHGLSGILGNRASVTIAKNIIHDNSTTTTFDELVLGGANQEVYQNTIHGSAGDGISVEAGGQTLRNNTVTGSAGFGIRIAGGAIAQEDHNLITDATTGFGTGTNNAAGQISSGSLDATDINADPQFTDAGAGDFTLTEPSSPAINAGIDLGVNQPDMNGAAAGLFNGPSPDIGALESTTLNVAPALDLDADDSSGQSGIDFRNTFTEGGGPAAIADADATLTDVDSTDLSSLTVAIANLQDGAAEVITADVSGTNILPSYDSVNGILTLSGIEPTADYEQVLKTIAYENTSVAPTNGVRDIVFAASDGTASSPAATAFVTVTGINEAPTLDLDSDNSSGASDPDFQTTFVEDGGAVGIADADASLSDNDSTNLQSLTATITNLLDGSAESLTADTTGTAIMASYDSGAGELLLSGSDSVTNYQQVLRTVVYDNSSDTPDVTTRLVNFVADDGTDPSQPATATVAMTSMNDPPSVGAPASQSTIVDSPLVFNTAASNLLSITDPDAASAPIEATISVTNGTFSLSGTSGLSFTTGDGSSDATMIFTGSLPDINAALDNGQYTPTPAFSGMATLQIDVDDQGNTGGGSNGLDSHTVNINVSNAGPLAATGEFLVNVGQTTSGQETSNEDRGSSRAIATALDGSYVVVWTDNHGADAGVVGQRYNRFGEAQGSNFGINQTTSGHQRWASVDTDSVGNFVVSWVSENQDGTPRSVYARRYAADGTALTGEFRVNTSNTGTQDNSSVAVDADGDFVVVWEGDGSGGYDIYGRRYDSSGSAQGNEFQISTSTPSGEPAVAMADDGRFITVWDDGVGVRGHLYDANGNSVTGVFTVHGESFAGQAAVAMDSDGDFAVVWRETNGGKNVYFRQFDSSGNPIGSTTQLNTTTANTQTNPSVDVDADGNFVAVWEGRGPGDTDGVFYRRFTAGGAALDAAEVLVNSTTSGTQDQASVAVQNTNNYAIVWTGNGPGDADGVFVRQFGDANLPPVNSVPTAQSVDEDGDLLFSGATGNLISISDPDAGSATVELTLTATNGLLTLPTTAGLTFSVGDGTDDPVQRFQGTIVDINTALDGLLFEPVSDYAGSANLDISTTDLGNTGTGGAQADSDSVAITVDPVNDPPMNSVPGSQTTVEDTRLTFSNLTSNLISVADIDVGGNQLEVTLSATNGTLSLSGTAGLTFSTGEGIADASMTFQGTVSSVNAALDGLAYDPNKNYFGGDQITIATDDLGNSGSGGPMSDTSSVAITVTAVDDPPIADNDPGTYRPFVEALNPVSYWRLGESSGSAVEDVAGSNTGTVNGATLGQPGAIISDADTASSFDGSDDFIEVPHSTDYQISDGTVQFWFETSDTTQNADLFSKDHTGFGTGGHLTIGLTTNGHVEVRLQSTTQSNFVESNNTLSNDEWHHVAFTFGSAGMKLYVDGVLADTNSFTGGISGNVEPIAIGAGTTVSSQGSVAPTNAFFDGELDEIAIFDSELNSSDISQLHAAGTELYRATEETLLSVAVSEGVLVNDFDAENAPLQATLISNAANGVVTLNTDGSFTYMPDPNFIGTDTFTYKASDGGLDSNVATATISVSGVNDPPENSIPVSDSTDEDTSLTFSSANGNAIVVTDVDAGSNSVEVTLSAQQGTLTLNGTAGLTFSSGDGSADATMTFTGTLLSVNAALDGLIYDSAQDYFGAEQIVIASDDLGNTGAGGAKTDTDTISITVDPVNDPPTALDDSYTIAEDQVFTPNAAAGVLANDTDIDSPSLQAVLVGAPTNGSVVITADGSFTYTPDTDFVGVSTFTYKANDGQLDSNVATVTITTTSVNDPPVATDNSYSVDEEAASTSGNVISDDTGAGVDGDDISNTLLLLELNGDPALVGVPTNLPSGATILAEADGSFNYDLNNQFQHLAAGESFVETLSYTIADGWDVRMVRVTGDNIDNLTEAEGILAAATGLGPLSANGEAYTVDVFADEAIDLIDYGTGIHNTNDDDFEVNNPFPGGPHDGGDDFVVRANSWWLAPAGTYTIAFGSDDGGAMSLGQGLTFSSVFNSDLPAGQSEIRAEDPRSHDVTGGTFTLSQPTNIDLTALMFERRGGTSFEVSIASGTHGSFDPGSFQLLKEGTLGWQAAASSATLAITVDGVNDAPSLDIISGFSFTTIDDDQSNPAGDTVSDLLASVAGLPISDVDTTDPRGIAIVGENSAFGTWQFSTNGGGSWTTFSGTSDSSAVTLAATAKVRFVPVNGQQGTATLLFRAWDQSGFANGQAGVDATATGGTTPFSTAFGIANLVVNDTSEPPTVSGEVYTVASNATLPIAAPGLLQNDFDPDSPTPPPATPGASLIYSAALDTDGDSTWENQASANLNWSLSGGVTRLEKPVTDRPGIHATYLFNNAGGTANSLESLTGDPTDGAASFELWVRPANDTDHDVLFETGGTTDGTSISLDDDTLHFRILDTESTAEQVETTAVIAPGEFTHVVGVFNQAAGEMRLYINGSLVDVAANSNVNDWAGSNGAGLGRVNGVANFAGGTNLEGEIALFRFYEAALTAPQVFANYQATAAGVKVVGVGTPSGGQISFQPDGSFVFNPDGDFDSLKPTESGNATFTYTVQDGSGLTADATATITVQGVDDPPVTTTDTYSVNSGEQLVVTDINAGVLGNDADPEGNTPQAGTLTVTVTTPPTKGTVTLNADGTFTYTPDPGELGTDEFFYVADDGVEQSGPTRVVITINVGAGGGGGENGGGGEGGGEGGGDSGGEGGGESGGEGGGESGGEGPSGGEGDGGGSSGPEGPPLEQQPGLGDPVGDDQEVSQPISPNQPAAAPSELVLASPSENSSTASPQQTRTRSLTSSGALEVAEQLTVGAFDVISSPAHLVAPELTFVVKQGGFWDGLDSLDDMVEQEINLEAVEIALSAGASTAVMAGYVIWIMRGGFLMTALLAQMPAWSMVNPLPIFAGGDLDEDGEDLASMLQKSNEEESDEGTETELQEQRDVC